MFVMTYTEGEGWRNPEIKPYGPLSVEPACMTFHYGQAAFEGLKAYAWDNGEIALFRPKMNMARLNLSNERLCMPAFDADFAVEAVKELVRVDADWIPAAPGTSLYIRPFVFGSESFLGVHPSHTYYFIVILSPVGAYYKEGLNPVGIYVESEYVRAVRGGLGFTKAAANYAASLKAQMDAQAKGYAQVLWLDGVEKKYIEEVGTMNVFFKINGEVITPALNGSILAGVTRDSALRILKDWGVPVRERALTIAEVYEAHENGALEEAFGTGTAAVISPVGRLDWNGKTIELSGGKIGPLSQRLYDEITGIQSGKLADRFGFIEKV
jgi:branched-chain amino acid aminotransferase